VGLENQQNFGIFHIYNIYICIYIYEYMGNAFCMYIGLTVRVRGAAIWTATRAGTDRPPLPDVQIGKPDGRQEKGGRRAVTGKDY
jgi:hypothetical protein